MQSWASRVAGGGATDADGALGTQTEIQDCTSLAVGPDGEVYFGEQGRNRIRVLNARDTALTLPGGDVAPGTVVTVAGGNGAGV